MKIKGLCEFEMSENDAYSSMKQQQNRSKSMRGDSGLAAYIAVPVTTHELQPVSINDTDPANRSSALSKTHSNSSYMRNAADSENAA